MPFAKKKKTKSVRKPTKLQSLRKETRASIKTAKSKLAELKRDLRSLGIRKKISAKR